MWVAEPTQTAYTGANVAGRCWNDFYALALLAFREAPDYSHQRGEPDSRLPAGVGPPSSQETFANSPSEATSISFRTLTPTSNMCINSATSRPSSRYPRDLIASAYFSHLHSHTSAEWPELEEHKLCSSRWTSRNLDNRRRWDHSQLDVLELRREDVTIFPYEGFLRIFEFLGSWKRPTCAPRAAWRIRCARAGTVFGHRREYARLPRSKARTTPERPWVGRGRLAERRDPVTTPRNGNQVVTAPPCTAAR
jgi:hypothetical protein